MRCATGWGEGAFSMSKSSGVIAPASEAEAFFKANPNVDSIEMIYTDMGGVPRGQRLRQPEVIAVYENGRLFPGSITAVDIQIGRASCRERVCQYVYISGFSVSLNKNKQTIMYTTTT